MLTLTFVKPARQTPVVRISTSPIPLERYTCLDIVAGGISEVIRPVRRPRHSSHGVAFQNRITPHGNDR